MAVLPQRRHPALRAAADAAGRKLSAEDVQVVRAAYEGLAAAGPEGMIAHIHEDFSGVIPPEMSAEPDTYEGHDGVRRYFTSFDETVEDLEFILLELVDDGDRVLARTTMRGRGRESGVPVEMEVTTAMTIREGKVLRMMVYRDMEEARAARGAN